MKRVLAAALLAGAAAAAWAAEDRPGLAPCRLRGVEHEAWCGQVKRPLDPAAPHGVQIDVHFAVLPALARHRKPDPVFLLAGGPGQSAIDLAGPAGRLLGRLANRRDVVLVDQRGTGRSAPLACEADDEAVRPLADSGPARQLTELAACRERLRRLPYGDLRRFTTTLAMQDVDAVRQRLGAPQINLVGGSYGTRAALEYLRQFPGAVRRVVLDGVAPPDMALPAAFSTDGQAAFDALLAACEAEAACRTRHPALRAQWQALLASLPRTVTLAHPLTGEPETLAVTRDLLLGWVRLPLYQPFLASALPQAIAQAAQGRFEGLAALATAFGGGRDGRLWAGLHFSVVCAEDMGPLVRGADRPGADFGDGSRRLYEQACADWPRGEVPADFYRVPPSPAPVLLLSGGIDPATPPRHAARVAQALGAKARHVVVPQAGHGVMALGCMRDVLFRFIDADDEAQALAADTTCARNVPRPPAFVPVEAAK